MPNYISISTQVLCDNRGCDPFSKTIDIESGIRASWLKANYEMGAMRLGEWLSFALERYDVRAGFWDRLW
jgi:hypothetical protein